MKMKKNNTKVVLLVLVCVGILFFIFKPSKNTLNLKDFDIDTVTVGDITKTITANGTINPVNVIEVGAQVSGRIEKIFVDYNDQVKKNQRLAELDTSILKKEVGEAESVMNKAKANLDLVDLNYQRTAELFKNNYIAKVELDQAETELKNVREEYNIAKSQYERAKINLSYAFINSPVSGVVISREVDIGQTVASSFSAPILFKIAEDLTKMQIETSVSEADIGSVKEGQTVEFTVDSYPNKVFEGYIKQIRLNPTTESNVVVYNVIIEIKNETGELMPGMTAYVTIPIGEVYDVKRIHTISLRFKPDARLLEIMGIKENLPREKGKVVLYKLVDKKKKIIEPVYAEIGLSDLSQIEIISDDLEDGDEIISNSVLITTEKKKK